MRKEGGKKKKDTHLLELSYLPDISLGSGAGFTGTACVVPLGLVLRKARC